MKSLGLTKEFGSVIDFPSEDEYLIEVLMIDTRTEERNEMKMMECALKRAVEGDLDLE